MEAKREKTENEKKSENEKNEKKEKTAKPTPNKGQTEMSDFT